MIVQAQIVNCTRQLRDKQGNYWTILEGTVREEWVPEGSVMTGSATCDLNPSRRGTFFHDSTDGGLAIIVEPI